MAKGKKTGGRQKGVRNKRTEGIEAFARSILEDPDYQRHLRERALTGALAPAVETMLFWYCYGKPVERIEQSGPDGGPMQYQDLTPDERQQRIQELAARTNGHGTHRR